jgi:hypothetical protein
LITVHCAGFAPELFGVPLNEGDVLDMQVVQKDGLPVSLPPLLLPPLLHGTAY